MIWSNLIGNYKQFIRERVRRSEPHRIYIESAQILSGKVDEICRLIPAFEKEIIWDTRGTRARTSQTKDSVIYTFKNGSTLENVAATEKTRGRRFQAGLMEECVGIDQDILNEVIIPQGFKNEWGLAA